MNKTNPRSLVGFLLLSLLGCGELGDTGSGGPPAVAQAQKCEAHTLLVQRLRKSDKRPRTCTVTTTQQGAVGQEVARFPSVWPSYEDSVAGCMVGVFDEPNGKLIELQDGTQLTTPVGDTSAENTECFFMYVQARMYRVRCCVEKP